MLCIRGADQGKVGFVGDGKDDPPIRALEEIAFVVIKEAAGDDVAAPNQPDVFGGIQADGGLDQLADPRTGRIHQEPRRVCLACTGYLIFGLHDPLVSRSFRGDNLGLRHDLGTPVLGITGVQHDKAAVFNPAIGIFKRLLETVIEGATDGICLQIDVARTRQDLSTSEMIIKKQAKTDQPCGATPLHPRHDKAEQARGRRFAIKTHVAVVG